MNKKLFLLLALMVFNVYQLFSQLFCSSLVQPYLCPNQIFLYHIDKPTQTWKSVTVTVDNGTFPEHGNSKKVVYTKAIPTDYSLTINNNQDVSTNSSTISLPDDLHVKAYPFSGNFVHMEVKVVLNDTTQNYSEGDTYYVRSLPMPTGFQPGLNGVLVLPINQSQFTLTTLDFEHSILWCYDIDTSVSDYIWSIPSCFTAPTTTSKEGTNGSHTSNTFTGSTFSQGTIGVRTRYLDANNTFVSSELSIQVQRILDTPQFSTLPSDNLLCNGQTGTIAITNIQYAESYTWTVTSGNILIGNNYSSGVSELTTTTTSINIVSFSQGQGNSTIAVKANRTGILSSVPQLVSIWTGAPIQPTIQGPDLIDETMLFSNIYYQIANPMNQSTIQWSATGALQTYGNTNDWRCQVIPSNVANTAQVSVTITNSCGSKNHSKAVWVDIVSPFSIYPNPASTEFTIDLSLVEPENSTLTDEYYMLLQGQDGLNYMVSQSKEKLRKFSLKKISEGLYFVVIRYKGKVYTKSLVVKKK